MSEAVEQEIRTLRTHFWSDRDPEGRAFAPLADAYRRKGDLAEADALLKDGLGRLPDFATGRLVAGRVRRDQGRLEDALSELDRLLGLDGRNVLGLVERAGVRLAMGDRESALADVRQALELEPEHADALRLRDELEAPAAAAGEGGEGDAETVAPAAPEADEPAPDAAGGVPPTRTLGELYAKQGFHDRAVAVYERLLGESPGDPELEARLDELRAAAGSGSGVARAEDPAEGPAPPAADVPDEPEERAPQWTGSGAFDGAVEEALPWAGPAPGEEADVEPVGRSIGTSLRDLMAWAPGAVPIATLAPDAPGPVPIARLAPDDVGTGPSDGVGEAP